MRVGMPNRKSLCPHIRPRQRFSGLAQRAKPLNPIEPTARIGRTWIGGARVAVARDDDERLKKWTENHLKGRKQPSQSVSISAWFHAYGDEARRFQVPGNLPGPRPFS